MEFQFLLFSSHTLVSSQIKKRLVERPGSSVAKCLLREMKVSFSLRCEWPAFDSRPGPIIFFLPKRRTKTFFFFFFSFLFNTELLVAPTIHGPKSVVNLCHPNDKKSLQSLDFIVKTRVFWIHLCHRDRFPQGHH